MLIEELGGRHYAWRDVNWIAFRLDTRFVLMRGTIMASLPKLQFPVFISYACADFRIANAIRDLIETEQSPPDLIAEQERSMADRQAVNPMHPLLQEQFPGIEPVHPQRESIMMDAPPMRMIPPDLAGKVNRLCILTGEKEGFGRLLEDGWHANMPSWMSGMALRMGEANSLLFVCTPNSLESDAVQSELSWFSSTRPDKEIWIARVNGTSPARELLDQPNVKCFEFTVDVDSMLEQIDEATNQAEAESRWVDARFLLTELLNLYRLKGASALEYTTPLCRRGNAELKAGAQYLATKSFEIASELAEEAFPPLRVNALNLLAYTYSHWLTLDSDVQKEHLCLARDCWSEALSIAHKAEWQDVFAEFGELRDACQEQHEWVNNVLGSQARDKLLSSELLALAARSGDLGETIQLLNSGQDPTCVTAHGDTILGLACHGGHDSVVEALLSHGAEIEKLSSSGYSALHFAVDNGDGKTAEALLRHGANVNRKGPAGIDALLLAVQENREEITKLLLLKGAEVNTREDTEGLTPLIIACHWGRVGIARVLIDNGADIEIRDNWGWTPLMKAAAYGHTEIVDALLESGARVNAITNEGISALYIAAQEGQVSAVRTLIDANADPNLARNGQITPLDVATHKGHADIVSLLQQRRQ
jgi:ankyrin repeat protein